MAELSIVLPIFNVDQYLGACLDSIKSQSFTDWECILVDDGSIDLSGHICDNFARRDNRFRVIHQKNAGVSASRNVGIDAATAPLLSFVDADDFISENYFELLIQEMRRIDADVAVSSFRLVQEDGDVGEYGWSNRFLQYREKGFTCEMMDNDAVVDAVCKDVFGCNSWAKIFRRGLWGTTRFPPIDLGEDVAVIPATIIKAKRAIYVPGAKYFYRQRERSLLHGSVTVERHRENIHASEVMLQSLMKYAPDRAIDFALMKFSYDLTGSTNFLQSNPGITQGKSKLYAILQAAGKL